MKTKSLKYRRLETLFVSRLRNWLILFRAHTAILEMPLSVLGAAIAIGSLWEPVLVHWAILGFIYHISGYGMNSYADWKKGYDKKDLRKQHHPLNKGEINPKTAKYVIYGLLGAWILYAEILTGFKLVTHASITIMLVSGITYNYYGKEMKHKYVPIAIVHTMVFVFPYLVYAENYTLVFGLATLAIFIHMIYQILISGDIKDLDQDESGILRNWGTKIKAGVNGEPIMLSPFKLSIASNLLVLSEILLSLLVVYRLNFNYIFSSLTVAMAFWMAIEARTVIKGGYYDRDKRVSAMSRKELAGIWMILASFTPIIGVIGWIVIVVLSLMYLVALSRFMWGSNIRPKV